MSLYNLIERVPDFIKVNQFLNEDISKLLRYSFLPSESEILDPDVVNSAIINLHGSNLLYNSALRKNILKYNDVEIKNLGFTVSEYEEVLKKDFSRIFIDFNIEDRFVFEKQNDERPSKVLLNPRHNAEMKISGFPHSYQKDLKDRILLFFKNVNVSCIANMPTGGGKTKLAMEALCDILRNLPSYSSKKNIIWIVDSTELAEQSFLSFEKIWLQKGDCPIVAHRFFTGFDDLQLNPVIPNVIFCTFSLVTARLSKKEINTLFDSSFMMVIDECHATNANTYRQVLDVYRKSDDFRVLGLTATPFRSDDDEFVTLRGLFNDTFMIDTGQKQISPIGFLQENGYLSKVDFVKLETENVKNRTFSYYSNLHSSILSVSREHIAHNKNLIIFAESKSHAISLSILLKSNGLLNELIVGETPAELRQIYLERFADNNDNLNILVNHQILSTGIDVPGLNSIAVLANIESPTLGLQVLGRAMRGPKNGGNPENTIYLTKYNYTKLENFRLLEEIVLNN